MMSKEAEMTRNQTCIKHASNIQSSSIIGRLESSSLVVDVYCQTAAPCCCSEQRATFSTFCGQNIYLPRHATLMNASNLFVMGCLTLTSLDIADIPDYIRHREWEEPEEPPATKVLPPSDHVIGKQNGLQVSTTFSRPSKSATVLKIKAKIDRDVAPKTCVPSSIRGLGDGLSSRKRKDGELIITKPSVKSTVRPAWENDNKDCTNEVYRHTPIEDDWLESAASSQRKKPKLKQSKIVFGK